MYPKLSLLVVLLAVSFPLAAATNPNAKAGESQKTNLEEASMQATDKNSPEKNLKSSQTFLEENKKQPNVISLPSGLQYKIVQQGAGESPGPTDFVTVHYRGTLIDGTEFDSSYAHKEPATFAVNAVIPGWTEALQLMKPGAKWTIYLPPNLAYGARGAGSRIGPNAALIFEIELLAVKPSFIGDDALEDPNNEWEDSD